MENSWIGDVCLQYQEGQKGIGLPSMGGGGRRGR